MTGEHSGALLFCLREPVHRGTDLASTFCFLSDEDAGILSWQMQEEPRRRQRAHGLQLSLLHPGDWALSRRTQSLGKVVVRHCRAGWAGKQHGAATIFTVQGHHHEYQGSCCHYVITPKRSSYPRILRARPRPPQVTKN